MTQVNLQEKSVFHPQFCSLPQINCKIQKEWVKTFWPFKNKFHTYTHTLSCIPEEIQFILLSFRPFLGKKWLGKYMLSVV